MKKLGFSTQSPRALLIRVGEVLPSLRAIDAEVERLGQALTGEGPQGRTGHWEVSQVAQGFVASAKPSGDPAKARMVDGRLRLEAPEGMTLTILPDWSQPLQVEVEFVEPAFEGIPDRQELLDKQLAFLKMVRDVTAQLRLFAGEATDAIDEEVLATRRSLLLVDLPA